MTDREIARVFRAAVCGACWRPIYDRITDSMASRSIPQATLGRKVNKSQSAISRSLSSSGEIKFNDLIIILTAMKIELGGDTIPPMNRRIIVGYRAALNAVRREAGDRRGDDATCHDVARLLKFHSYSQSWSRYKQEADEADPPAAGEKREKLAALAAYITEQAQAALGAGEVLPPLSNPVEYYVNLYNNFEYELMCCLRAIPIKLGGVASGDAPPAAGPRVSTGER
jgi:uncharacterized membrane protein